MGEYDKVCIETFLKNQLKLFPEKVAETPEEAVAQAMALITDAKVL